MTEMSGCGGVCIFRVLEDRAERRLDRNRLERLWRLVVAAPVLADEEIVATAPVRRGVSCATVLLGKFRDRAAPLAGVTV